LPQLKGADMAGALAAAEAPDWASPAVSELTAGWDDHPTLQMAALIVAETTLQLNQTVVQTSDLRTLALPTKT
jgi:hypothetical protein